jgi:hypothetical protein
MTETQEEDVLAELQAAVQRTRAHLRPDSPWLGTLQVLDQELGEGQPFLLRVARASSSKSA